MTKDNNGWPGEPGVPQNPDRDGVHWLVRKNEEFPEPWEWASGPDGWCAEYGDQSIGRWCEKDGDGQPKEIAKWYSYLGPCLPPETANALISVCEDALAVEIEAGFPDSELADRLRAALAKAKGE